MIPIIDYLNPYAYLMRLRRMMYERGWLRSYHPGIPVISVGNLSIGGTGKSPLVLLIADYIEKKHGKRVAIISRGYKRHSKGFVLVRNVKEILAPVENSGDEAQMFAELLPNAIVIVDEDRVHGALEAKALGADVIVLDDGYQHLRLKRDLNILLSNGLVSPVLPFGRSREPASAARAADIVVKDKKDLNDRRDTSLNAKVAIQQSVPSTLTPLNVLEVPLTELYGKSVLALSSIASPERFHAMLRELGAIVTPYALADHAEYSAESVRKIFALAKKNGAQFIVTTMKDAVKSRTYFEREAASIPVLILRHKLEFLSGEQGFYDAIDRIL